MSDNFGLAVALAFLIFVGGCTTGHTVTLSVVRESAVNAGAGEWRIAKHGERSFHWVGTHAPGTRGPAETPAVAQ
jgi:hypothetical protein